MNIDLDLRRSAGAFPKFWTRCFGSEHAGHWLRQDMSEHHRLGKAAFHNEFVRFHGILSEPIGVASRGKDKKIQYHWFNFERAYDRILDLGMRPFVEYSYMPACMASGKQTIFYWKGNVTLPKKVSEWEELIEACTRRIVGRYGKAEARRWYYEVWNEPNLRQWFFAGSQADYFRLYDAAARAIKKVDGHLRVGGPATACAEWIDDFIAHCRKAKSPVDFVSYHLYPSDPFWMAGQKMDFKWMGEEFFRNHIRKNHEIVRRNADLGLEIHMTEWNASSNARDPIHDGPAAAAFAVKAIQEVAGLVDSFSWWTMSDVFEEGGQPPKPFHGGFGLLTIDGLKKPAFHAFEALQELGDRLLAPPMQSEDHSAGCIPTIHADKGARLLFWGFHTPKSPKPPRRTVRLRLKGFAPARKKALYERYLIDARHSNIKNKWLAMGSPDSLTPKQAAALKLDNELALAETRTLSLKNGEAEVRFPLDPDSVSYVVMR